MGRGEDGFYIALYARNREVWWDERATWDNGLRFSNDDDARVVRTFIKLPRSQAVDTLKLSPAEESDDEGVDNTRLMRKAIAAMQQLAGPGAASLQLVEMYHYDVEGTEEY